MTTPAPAPACTAPPEVRSELRSDPQARLDEVEIKLSFLEDLLDTLNTLVARQSEQIEVLGRELVRLKERTDRAERDGAGVPGTAAADERPPHY